MNRHERRKQESTKRRIERRRPPGWTHIDEFREIPPSNTICLNWPPPESWGRFCSMLSSAWVEPDPTGDFA